MKSHSSAPLYIVVLIFLLVYCVTDILDSILIHADIHKIVTHPKEFEGVPSMDCRETRIKSFLKPPNNLNLINDTIKLHNDCQTNELCRGRQKIGGWFGIRIAAAIRLHRLEAPQSVMAGQPIMLRCLFETKRDKLLSLSWYKNGREFYRYQPFERVQSVLIFNLTGVNVDTIRSRNNTVVLTNTTSDTSGRYKCEATGVSFQEVHLETYITVITPGSGVAPSINVDYLFSYVFLSIALIIFL